ncbi:MAG: hypothetical protein IJY19_03670 [Ruminococcus sp.]|nr:hypothetical protein [Ruminococcus sp.]
MVYSSLLFIYGFFPLSIMIYYIFRRKFPNGVLLILSMIFCGIISVYFLMFMILYTAVNFAACNFIEKKRSSKSVSGIIFYSAVIFDIAAIFTFRTDFFSGFKELIYVPDGFFPIGISFFTLSAVGTLIDVYFGRLKAEKNIVKFGLYIMFFPRLLMGPVLRYSSFIKMLKNRRDGLNEIGIGFTVFVKGLAKKVIAADSLYMLYSAVHGIDIENMTALTAWIGITAYLLCLYFTLSGFSDMGIGIGYCFGFRFPQSFNYPLFSTKIRYFTTRWHIQIIQWFRRYITKPLSSRFNNKIIKKLIFIAVWGLFGFWYTFSINGVVWGAIIGSAVTIENHFSNEKILNITGIIYTFLAVVIASVFLSGSDLSYSLKYLLVMLGGNRAFADSLSFYFIKSYIVILLISVYAATSLFRNLMIRSGRTWIRNAVVIVSPAIVMAFMIICTIMISYSGSSEMILLRL